LAAVHGKVKHATLISSGFVAPLGSTPINDPDREGHLSLSARSSVAGIEEKEGFALGVVKRAVTARSDGDVARKWTLILEAHHNAIGGTAIGSDTRGTFRLDVTRWRRRVGPQAIDALAELMGGWLIRSFTQLFVQPAERVVRESFVLSMGFSPDCTELLDGFSQLETGRS
jgi:hypothetical protein